MSARRGERAAAAPEALPAFARPTVSFRQVEGAGRGRRESSAHVTRPLERLGSRQPSPAPPAPPPIDDHAARFEGKRTQMRKGRAVFNMDCLKAVPLFKGCSSRFLEVLMENAQNEIFTDGQVIFLEGSHGDKMYVLHHGEVEVVIQDTVFKVLPSGSVFGEMAAMCRIPAAAKRNATIRAKGLCDCRVISREALMHATATFPADAKLIESESNNRLADLRAKQLLPEQRWTYIASTMVEEPGRAPSMSAWREESSRATRVARRSRRGGDAFSSEEHCMSACESLSDAPIFETRTATSSTLPSSPDPKARAEAGQRSASVTPSNVGSTISSIAAPRRLEVPLQAPRSLTDPSDLVVLPRPPQTARTASHGRSGRTEACRRTAEHAQALAEQAARRVACCPTRPPRPAAESTFLRHTAAFQQRSMHCRKPGADVGAGDAMAQKLRWLRHTSSCRAGPVSSDNALS